MSGSSCTLASLCYSRSYVCNQHVVACIVALYVISQLNELSAVWPFVHQQYLSMPSLWFLIGSGGRKLNSVFCLVKEATHLHFVRKHKVPVMKHRTATGNRGDTLDASIPSCAHPPTHTDTLLHGTLHTMNEVQGQLLLSLAQVQALQSEILTNTKKVLNHLSLALL